MTDELEALWERLEKQNEARNATPHLDGFHRKDVIREMESLHDTAREFYLQDQIDTAMSIWHKARKLATKMGDVKRESKYLYYEGHCLRRSYRLTEALACLVELEGLQSDPVERWHGLIEQIIIAYMIPISLQNIEKLIFRCRGEMKRLSLQSSYSMLLLEEASLASFRHDSFTELSKLQEAMSVFNNSAYPLYNIHVHYYLLIDALFHNGDIANALSWLERYESVNTGFEHGKESQILRIQAKIAFLNGERRAGWDFIRRRLQLSREVEAHSYASLKTYTKAAIFCGFLTEARHSLAEILLYHRNSENGHRRYRVRCLTGDYHRAMIQYIELNWSENKAQIERHRNLARYYYSLAGKTGALLDQRLCCNWHEKEIEERLQSLDV